MYVYQRELITCMSSAVSEVLIIKHTQLVSLSWSSCDGVPVSVEVCEPV